MPIHSATFYEKKWVTEIRKYFSMESLSDRMGTKEKSIVNGTLQEFRVKSAWSRPALWQSRFSGIFSRYWAEWSSTFLFSHSLVTMEALNETDQCLSEYFMTAQRFWAVDWVEKLRNYVEKTRETSRKSIFSVTHSLTHTRFNRRNTENLRILARNFFAIFRGTFELLKTRFSRKLPYWFVLKPFNFVSRLFLWFSGLALQFSGSKYSFN